MIHDQYTELNLTKQQKYDLRHPDRNKVNKKAYNERNLAKVRRIKANYMTNFRKNNPKLYNDRLRPHNQRYRAVKRGATIGEVDIALLIAEWDRICGLCKEFVYDKYDIDHIVPLSKGGEHSQANLQLTHSTCNRSKGNRV